MDSILIKDLEIYAYHGVLEEEKRNGQTFIVTSRLFFELREAGIKDDLEKTVNYAEVCEKIYTVMTEDKYNLIESVAENVASAILTQYEQIQKVEITISKPSAPINRTFDTVCVNILRERHKVFLGIGSNIGDKEGYLDYAIDQLNMDDNIKVNRISTYIITKPYGDIEQDDFLNGCLEIETLYSPRELLMVISDIEKGAGRKRIVHWGPRTLDIDILLYDNEIIIEDDLMIPHIEMTKREFVLAPLMEIAPYVYHPGYNKTIKDLYEELV